MKVNFKVQGLASILSGLRTEPARVNTAMAGALYKEANKIMTRSKELVPVDTGALKNSGYVELPKVEGNTVTVEMGYGGPAAPYALRQHEDLALNHPNGGQALYLAQPFNEAKSGMAGRIAAEVRKRTQ